MARPTRGEPSPALKLTYRYRLPASVTNHAAVIGHLREVLNVFASKADCNKFYIGITNDLKRRRREHERERPEYALMCAIYKEEINIVSDEFSQPGSHLPWLQFQGGVVNKATNRVLRCGNDVSGSPAKNWLYLLVDKRDVSDIPVNSRDAAMWGDEI
ncbi:MAG: GIY-YIG nuclease family protein [Candidatus Competibacteraceae bacterium]